jgi:chromosome segregation ATPase
MGIRNSIQTALSQPKSFLLESTIRQVVEEVLANRGFVMPGEHRALREEVTALKTRIQDTEDTDELKNRVAALEKKLQMAMGALQAATSQIVQAGSTAEQAQQRATSAQSTAESTSDGLTGLEDAFAALVERIGRGAESATPSLPDFTVLDRSIADIKTTLATGSYDVHLPALLAAEEAGRSRTGAIKAIRSRM